MSSRRLPAAFSHRPTSRRLSSTILPLVATIGATWWLPSTSAAEESPLTAEAIEVRRFHVDPAARFEDARGLALSLEYRVGSVEVDKALFLVARLSKKGGQKVDSLVKSAAFRDGNDGSLHGKKQLIAVPRGSWRKTSLFVPYYTMKLAPGTHPLSIKLEAVSDPGRCKYGELPHLVRIIGKSTADFELTKPPFKMVRILVRHVQVVEEATDVSLWPWRARPDLRWRARFRAGAGGVVFESEVRDDTYSADWTQYSPVFPFSQGDRMTLSVLDQDVMGHDTLGSVKLTLDELLHHDTASPLSAGKASAIVLGPVKTR